MLIVSALIDAPLGVEANPGMSPNPAKAPWYFLGIQELLIHFHPIVAVVVLPLAATAFLVALPWLVDELMGQGRWFLSDRGTRSARLAALAALLLIPLAVVLDEYYYTPWAVGAELSTVMARGVIPLLITGTSVAILNLVINKLFSLNSE